MTKRAPAGIGGILLVLPLAMLLESGTDRAPAEKWAARYNGPANGDDSAAAMVLDAKGNVCVVGTSAGSGTGTDIVVVKFDADSNQLWAQRYDGPAHGDDAAQDIAVDAAGNVFVVGTTKSAKGTDITTIKYSAAGKRIWVRTYDGIYHRNEDARAIAVDSQGAVIVCGVGSDSNNSPVAVLIKYGAKGARLWIKNGIPAALDISMATDVVVDRSDNIYVCGGKYSGNWDMLTAKFDGNGGLTWAKTLNGKISKTDHATAVAVAASGSVHITGTFKQTMVYDDYATIRYDKNGRLMWTKTYNGPAKMDDGPTGLAVDDLGNTYVTGWITIADYNWDVATIKYGPTGKVRWTKTYDGPTLNDSYDWGRAIALDRSGNVYVAGESRNDRANYDIITIKYDRAGRQAWLATYDGPAQSEDFAQAVVVDASGNIYVAGSSAGIGTGSDIVVIKYE